jgi:ferredoxin
LKDFLYPSEEVLYRVERQGSRVRFLPAAEGEGGAESRYTVSRYTVSRYTVPRHAFLGVRACDLAALAVLDAVLGGGDSDHSDGGRRADPRYRARRDAAFLVAVQCTEPWDTCFCSSLGTGPAVADGADLVLTELGADGGADGGGHRFAVEARGDAGREVAAELPLKPAGDGDEAAVAELLAAASQRMGRHLDAAAAPALLAAHPEHPQWDDVARRCLTCGNCTLVCPTCFCHTLVEESSLDGTTARRLRRWDTCFNVDHSYLHGGSVRTSPRSRYRQWLTHKLSTWVDQFGTPGCVGCGRCIAWCPAGIDLTAEVAAIAARPGG